MKRGTYSSEHGSIKFVFTNKIILANINFCASLFSKRKIQSFHHQNTNKKTPEIAKAKNPNQEFKNGPGSLVGFTFTFKTQNMMACNKITYSSLFFNNHHQNPTTPTSQNPTLSLSLSPQVNISTNLGGPSCFLDLFVFVFCFFCVCLYDS